MHSKRRVGPTDAATDLSEIQRSILVSLFRKTVQTEVGQSVKWVPQEEFPTIALSVLARSLRELENLKLVIRLPQKHVKLTGLGIQIAVSIAEHH